MSKSAQLPAWLKSRYQDVFELVFPEDKKAQQLATKSVEYSLPPPNKNDVISACRLYAVDNDVTIEDSIIEKINDSPHLSSEHCTTTGSQYPLFFALDRNHLLNKDGESARNARRLLSQMFRESIDYAIPSIYISQLRNIRNLLVSAVENEKFHDLTLRGWNDIHMIYSSPSMRDEFKKKSESYKVFCELQEKTRLPGKPVRKEQVGRIVKRGRNPSKSLSNLQIQRRQIIADAKPAPKARTSQQKDDNTKDSDISTKVPKELASLGYRVKKSTSSISSKPDESDLTLVRYEPSQLTPDDDRRTARKISAMATTDALKTIEDTGMLTPWQIYKILNIGLPDPAWVLCRLLLLTGMPLSRIKYLEANPYSNNSHAIISSRKVFWDRDNGVIYYRLADGPSPSINGDATNCIITLSLPIEIQDKLQSIDNDRPLLSSQKQLNLKLRRHFSENPGISPTANRVRMTSYLILRQLSPTNHLVKTLSGQYGPLDAAPAAYRAVMRKDLQSLFDSAAKSLGLSIKKIETSVSQKLNIPNYFGSCRILPKPTSWEWFNALREAFNLAEEKIHYRLPTDSLPVDDIIVALKISSANTYLAWLLGTGGRPVSERTRIVISKAHAWINDKNSRKGPESRLVMIPEILYKQLQAHYNLTAQAISLIESEGLEVIDERIDNQQSPPWISKSRNSKKVVIRPMYHRDWKSLIKEILPHTDISVPDNATRHTETSALNNVLNESIVDATIGHIRIGKDRTRPKSLASMRDQLESLNWQERIMVEMGYSLMEGDSSTWKS